MPVSCLVVPSRRSRDRKRDFQLQTTQTLEASCLFSFKSILLHTSEKCQSIKRTACMLNFIYIVQSKWYLRLKISVQGPFKSRSRGGRWSWTLTFAQKRSWAGRWSWAAKVGLLSLRVVPQQLCNGHCPCDSAQRGRWNSNCAVPH